MAYYADDGMCFWCFKPEVGEFMGIPLCEKHLAEEEMQFLRDCGTYYV